MADAENVDSSKRLGPDRRSFLRKSAFALGAATVRTSHFASAAVQPSVASSTLSSSWRQLGKLKVSSIGLGCADFTGMFYGTTPKRSDMVTLARAAHDRGITMFDAAEAYGPFEVERILGEALAPVRDQVVYSSKFGWNIDMRTGKYLGGLNSRPERLRLSVDAMLKRWQTDRMDLVYQHRVDPKVPIEDVAGTIKDLIAEGKVVHFGLSEPGPQTLRRAHAVQPVSAVQNEYSIMARDPETTILPICAELGIGFVCWSPLATGLLTATIGNNTQLQERDVRLNLPWFAPENRAANLAVVAVVQRWAHRKGITPA